MLESFQTQTRTLPISVVSPAGGSAGLNGLVLGPPTPFTEELLSLAPPSGGFLFRLKFSLPISMEIDSQHSLLAADGSIMELPSRAIVQAWKAYLVTSPVSPSLEGFAQWVEENQSSVLRIIARALSCQFSEPSPDPLREGEAA